jgi:hypothetical protein
MSEGVARDCKCWFCNLGSRINVIVLITNASTSPAAYSNKRRSTLPVLVAMGQYLGASKCLRETDCWLFLFPVNGPFWYASGFVHGVGLFHLLGGHAR